MTVVYDIETYPNCFLLSACSMNRSDVHTWEISDRIDDSTSLREWLNIMRQRSVTMIGFNNLAFDYPVIHSFLINECRDAHALYQRAHDIINGDRFNHMIWPSDRLIPQIDLYKIHHFDNAAKSQSLKGLQFNMRSDTVDDLPIPPGTVLTHEQMNTLRSYCEHDVTETVRFAQISADAMSLRQSLIDSKMLSGDVMNFNDVKIGTQIFIQRLGDNACYERDDYGRRKPRQTRRPRIALSDVVFPYISFIHPDLQRVHKWMMDQTLEPHELDPTRASTRGVFSGVSASIAGMTLHYGVGGLHGSVERRNFTSNDTHVIIDCDVASMYPSIMISNKLYPAHLGVRFIDEYKRLRHERFQYARGTPENQALKLALNGSYGSTNDKWSPLYDPLVTMRVTINGQLMMSMLIDMLVSRVPELTLIQINTDGVTAYIRREHLNEWKSTCTDWELATMLELEHTTYDRMCVRDVNNYVAQSGDYVKRIGVYWAPKSGTDYEYSIGHDGPSSWHKNLSSTIIADAAVAQMLYGVDVADTIMTTLNPHEFLLREKTPRNATFMIGDMEQQRVCRYYVSNDGGVGSRISPPPVGETVGAFKRKSGVSRADYLKYDMYVHNPAVHTANHSRYTTRTTSVQAGYLLTECNDMRQFDYASVNIDWYIEKARSLVIE